MIFGEFEAYCNNCGIKVITDVCGKGMWRAATKWHVCGKECHDAMEIKDVRSILGKKTPPYKDTN